MSLSQQRITQTLHYWPSQWDCQTCVWCWSDKHWHWEECFCEIWSRWVQLVIFNNNLQVVDIRERREDDETLDIVDCCWNAAQSRRTMPAWQLLKCRKVDGSSTQSMYLMDLHNIMEICLSNFVLPWSTRGGTRRRGENQIWSKSRTINHLGAILKNKH